MKKEQAIKKEAKILVVDDREDNLFSIEAILEKGNYSIVKANSGRAALKILLKEHDFSLILMDVQMPDLNGFETATIIYEREKLRNIPIIFITAFSNDEDHMFRGYQMGGVDYIYKPINPELLRAKVSVFVDLYRKTHQLQQQEKKLLSANKSLQKEIEDRKSSEAKVQLLNRQLVEINSNLRQMNEELDQFAYMASHDLQEPLRKIQMFSDKIMVKKQHDEESEKYFSRIISASRRMQSLINNLLDFSRHSVIPADFRVTDLNQLLKDSVHDLEGEIEKNKVRVQWSNLPVISAVPSLLSQLFQNLLSNAIKFRREGVDPEIRIRAEQLSTEELKEMLPQANGSVYYKIFFSDNGIGFDAKHNHEIFKVFKRLHSYHEYEGTGVGLSICKKIVEKHGGYIRAEGELGKGTTFIMILPETQLMPGIQPKKDAISIEAVPVNNPT
jgi:signal transduction histidine kinase